MHLSDTLVFGPLSLAGRSVRLPLGAVLAGLLGLLLAGAAAALFIPKPLPAPITPLAARLPISLPGLAPTPTPAAPGIPVHVASAPAGATILLDGQALGTTPATEAVPPGHPLAALAREHASWTRRELPALGLLARRVYLVVPAEDLHEDSTPTAALRQRLRRQPVPPVTVDRARTVLAERCARLLGALQAAGVRARRLDDLALVRLYRACWNQVAPDADRFDRDLVAALRRTP